MIICISNTISQDLIGSGGVSPQFDAYVFIQWSQSNGGAPNSVLEADLPAELQGVQPARFYDLSTGALNGAGTWADYRVGVACNQPNVDTDGVGPDAKLVEQLASVYSDKIYIIKWAPGGIGLKLDAVNPNYNIASEISGGYDHYKKLLTVIEQALRDIRLEEGIDIRRIKIANIIEIQGEEDAKKSDVGTYYYSDLEDIVNGGLDLLSSKRYDTSSTDYTILRTHNNLPAGTFPYTSDLRTQQQYFVDNYKANNPSKLLNDIHILNTDAYDLLVDDIHWNEAGVISAGTDVAALQTVRSLGSPSTYVGHNIADDVIYRVQTIGGQTISEAWKTKIGAFFTTVGEDEWYKVTSFGMSLNGANALVDWRGNGTNGTGLFTNNGATLTDYSHWDFNGTSNYINVGLRPTNTTVVNYNKRFTQNSAEIGAYCKQNDDKTTSIRSLFGLQATRHATIIQQPGSNRIIGYVNDATLLAYNNAADDYFNDATIYSMVRTASGARAMYKGETSVANDTTASTGLDGGYEFIVGAKNGSSITQYFDGQISCFWVSAPLTRATWCPAIATLLA
jgi:hypothetical protein